jgi:hypothetical protein
VKYCIWGIIYIQTLSATRGSRTRRGKSGTTNDSKYDHDHVVLWVNLLRAMGLDPEAIRSEVGKCTAGDVTQVYVGQHARTMPTDFVTAIVERALGDERAIGLESAGAGRKDWSPRLAGL